jgi:hypothetical protein
MQEVVVSPLPHPCSSSSWSRRPPLPMEASSPAPNPTATNLFALKLIQAAPKSLCFKLIQSAGRRTTKYLCFTKSLTLSLLQSGGSSEPAAHNMLLKTRAKINECGGVLWQKSMHSQRSKMRAKKKSHFPTFPLQEYKK